MSKKIAILAGNKKEFDNFMLGVINKNDFVYIDRYEKIYGIEFLELITIGTFYERKDWTKLYHNVNARIKRSL